MLLLGGPEPGDLRSGTREEVRKTVGCIYALVRQREIDNSNKKKHIEMVAE